MGGESLRKVGNCAQEKEREQGGGERERGEKSIKPKLLLNPYLSRLRFEVQKNQRCKIEKTPFYFG